MFELDWRHSGRAFGLTVAGVVATGGVLVALGLQRPEAVIPVAAGIVALGALAALVAWLR